MAKKSPPKPAPESVGERVQRLRGTETQAAFAKRAGMSVATLRNIEQDRGDVALSTLQKIAAALGVSVAVLVDGIGPRRARGRRGRGRPRSKQPPKSD